MESKLEMILKRGDVINYKGKGIFSFLVKLFTGSRYSHSACYVGNNWVVESVFGGVRFSTINYKRDFDIFRHNNATKKQLKEATNFMAKQTGKGYDFLGLIGIAYSILYNKQVNPLDNKERYWCSELIVDGYINAKIKVDTNIHTWKVAPKYFNHSKYFTKIYSHKSF